MARLEETSWTFLLRLTSLILGNTHRPKSNLTLLKLLEMSFALRLRYHTIYYSVLYLFVSLTPAVTLIARVTPTTPSRPASLTGCVFLPRGSATCHWEAAEPPPKSYTLVVKRVTTLEYWNSLG